MVIAVQGRTDGTAVIRTVVPDAEMTAGVGRAWLVLALLGVLLVLIGLAVADRLAGNLIRPIGELSAVSHRLARAELEARESRPDRPNYERWAGPSTIWRAGSRNCWCRSGNRWPTCRTDCGPR